jgi:hypothetical protein
MSERTQLVALSQAVGFGLGSKRVGYDDKLPSEGGTLSLVCAVCPRCEGHGFKHAALIAGKWVGGDTEYLCHRCRGTGAVTYALFARTISIDDRERG